MDTPEMRDKDNKLTVDIDTTGLSSAQIRQIKTLLTIAAHASKTSDESEYYNGGAEMMRLCASLIKQANFPNLYATNANIPYDQQAIEYAIDIVQDQISASRVVNYDN